MDFEFKRKYWIGIGFGMILLVIDILKWRETIAFWPIVVLSFSIGWIMAWMDFFVENKRQQQIEEKFPEFVRNLVGAIKSGMPVSRAIVHVSTSDYGSLSPYIRKLANQIEWAIPFHKALNKFAFNTGNVIIKRAVSTVIEAEKAGGNMEDVLKSITDSLVEIKKIKMSRLASVHSQITQSYVIFFVFLAIMIVIQNLLVPYMSSFSGDSNLTGDDLLGISKKVEIDFTSVGEFFFSVGRWFMSFHGILLMLSLIQGFFAGMIMGKLAEGELKYGLKHSLILVTIAFLVITLAQGFL